MSKKTKTTYEKHIESLTPKQKKEYEQGYKNHLLSELRIALKNQDKTTAKKLIKAAKIKNSEGLKISL